MAYIGQAPANKPVSSSDLEDGLITNSKLAQDIISGETELATAPADTDEFLISDAGVLKRLDASFIGGSNTPAFSAYLSSDQNSLSANTDHKITINAEDFDTDSAFDHSSNYRFTPQTAGKYFFHGQIKCSLSTANDFVAKIKKNGSDTKNRRMENVDQDAVTVSCIIDMNGSSDYVELFGRFTNTTFNAVSESGVTTFFFGYRLIT